MNVCVLTLPDEDIARLMLELNERSKGGRG